MTEGVGQGDLFGLGDETIAVQKMLILCTEFSFNFACFVIFYFCSTGY